MCKGQHVGVSTVEYSLDVRYRSLPLLTEMADGFGAPRYGLRPTAGRALPSPLARGDGRCFLQGTSCLQDLFSSEINLQKESYTIFADAKSGVDPMRLSFLCRCGTLFRRCAFGGFFILALCP